MRPRHWQQAGGVIKPTLTHPPGERADSLIVAGRDVISLHSRVDSQDISRVEASRFIGRPASEAKAEVTPCKQPVSLSGRSLGPYLILAKLGEGGVGEVYLAEDRRLRRRIALKLLQAHSTGTDDCSRRFRQEANTASSLNHPNIITVHEIGEIDGIHFIATEFVDGVTLRRRLAGARMTLAEVLEVGTQMASALAAAHQAGVVHRDVKPENVMLRQDGIVKVLDFGLAKHSGCGAVGFNTKASTQALPQTRPGMVMGTVAYMSPEQARGLEVDARTDVWSLGVVLYEMLAGRTPFEGETSSDVVSVILQKEPPPLARYAPDVPAELERIVAKALRKEREERYQVVKDMLLDLRSLKQWLEAEAELERVATIELSGQTAAKGVGRLAAFEVAGRSGGRPCAGVAAQRASGAAHLPGASKRLMTGAALALAAVITGIPWAAYIYFTRGDSVVIDSVAVLPFISAGSGPGVEWLGDGIAESTINDLSRLPRIRVMARSTAFRYKGREMDPLSIGRELKVRAVLTGRVVQQGENLIVSTELLKVEDGAQIWGEQYKFRLSDVLAVQQEISRETALRLTGREQPRVALRYTEDSGAYQLYLKGRFHWNLRTPADLLESLDYFQQAAYRDPNYAPAHAGLADCYNVTTTYGLLPPWVAMPRAKAAAQKAIGIDDTLAEAHTALAYNLATYEWDWAGAEREFRRAIELNPNYAMAHYFYALTYLVPMGRLDEAVEEMKKAQEIDPLSPIINTNLGWAYYYARRYDSAVEQLRRAIELEPEFDNAHIRLAEAYAGKGMYVEAVEEAQKGTAYAVRGYVYAVSGRRDEALSMIDQLRERSRQSYVGSYYIALIYTALGERELAFEHLQSAYDERDWFLPRLRVDPALDSIRSDARFAELTRRMNFPAGAAPPRPSVKPHP